jgi:hypothetical protein
MAKVAEEVGILCKYLRKLLGYKNRQHSLALPRISRYPKDLVSRTFEPRREF